MAVLPNALTLGDLDDIPNRVEQRLQSIDIFIRSQDVSALDLIPNRDIAALLHEPLVVLHRAGGITVELGKKPTNGQESRNLTQSGGGTVAAPPPLLRATYHTSLHRIEDNIPSEFEKMALFLDSRGVVRPSSITTPPKDGLEASLKQVAGAAVLSIDRLRVDSVDLAHASGKVRVGCFDEQVIVVGHQTIRMTETAAAFYDFSKNLKEPLAITIREEDRAKRIAAACDRIDRAIELKSQ